MTNPCKNCGESIIQTHHWGKRGWAHYWASRTCSKAEPIEEEQTDEVQEWFDALEDFEPVCEAHERFDCKRCAGRGVENAVEDL